MTNAEYVNALKECVENNRAKGTNKKIYLRHAKANGYDKLVRVDSSLKLEMEIPMLVTEGTKLLETEVKKPGTKKKVSDDSKKLNDALGENSKDPSIRARYQVLKSMAPDNRARIEKMEKDKNLDHPYYKEFVKAQVRLGDKLYNEPNETKETKKK